MKALILGLILATLVISGCVIFEQQQNTTNETPPPPPPPPPPKAPVVSIVSPTAEEVILSQEDTADVTLTLSTQNLIVKAPGSAAKVGEGHFRVTVDDAVPQTVTTKTYLISGLTVGSHKIKVELLNNDRTMYVPAVVKEVSFTIEKEKPKEYVPVDYTVSITDKYTPSSLTVKVGDRVTWTNNAQMPHTATCFISGQKKFDTQTLAPGKSATITMTEIMECEYYSQIFRALTGNIKVESNGTEATPSGSSGASLNDCGTSLQCFSNAADTCAPTKVSYTLTLFTLTTISYMEIRGTTNGKCDFYIRRDKYEMAGADAETQATYSALEGKDGTCLFEPSRLAEVMNNWQTGSFSTSDWVGSDCQGGYFSG
ncbi:MAG: hypothetical protein V1861_01365 [Candidatus Micrarchaeota archaeon]